MLKILTKKGKQKLTKICWVPSWAESQQDFFFLTLLGKVFTGKHFLLEKEPVLSKK
jgi:hypothetical protein